MGLQRLAAKPLFKAGAKVGSAKVQLGSSSEVALVAPRDLAVTVPAGVLSKVGADEDPLSGAGRRRRSPRASMSPTWSSSMPDGEQVMPLVAGEAVGQAGFFGRIWIGLKQLFGMA